MGDIAKDDSEADQWAAANNYLRGRDLGWRMFIIILTAVSWVFCTVQSDNWLFYPLVFGPAIIAIAIRWLYGRTKGFKAWGPSMNNSELPKTAESQENAGFPVEYLLISACSVILSAVFWFYIRRVPGTRLMGIVGGILIILSGAGLAVSNCRQQGAFLETEFCRNVRRSNAPEKAKKILYGVSLALIVVGAAFLAWGLMYI